MTVVQADASDENAIRTLCQRAVDENGRLDVYFANVSAHHPYSHRMTSLTINAGR